MIKILLVEDDKDLSEILKYNLEKENFKVDVVYNGKEVLKKNLHEYDLVILDIMLPEISGEELIEKIRKIKEDMPIIMITALEDENKKFTCFIKGADDYIVKPFSLREFILRVKALLRRAHILDRKTLSYEGIELDLEKKQVKINGKYKDLTKTEYLLLKYFLENPEKVLSKEELLQKFWQDEDENSRVVDVYVSRLRKKLGEKGKLIKTVPRLGYKLSK